jgi:hypothetical protein
MIPRTRITELWQMHSMLELLESAQGQTAKFTALQERPMFPA